MNGKETCELVECVESAGTVSISNFVATFFCYGIKIIYIFFLGIFLELIVQAAFPPNYNYMIQCVTKLPKLPSY